jgi:hypothetical protein
MGVGGTEGAAIWPVPVGTLRGWVLASTTQHGEAAATSFFKIAKGEGTPLMPRIAMGP